MTDWSEQLGTLGAYLRSQRQLANLSLRQLADMAQISNPYLSQLERGLHEPSVRVLSSLAKALNISAETLLEQAGLLSDDGTGEAAAAQADDLATEQAIKADARLTDDQKKTLLSVYRNFVAANEA
ncbi:MAG: helix-turn-helix domain-containing protein [Acidimicrobiia bacterium]